MIGSLRGEVIELEPAGDLAVNALIEVAGVGYRVQIGARHAATIGPIGSTVFVSVHTHMRDAAITLYGFKSSEERRCFEALLLAHGVGPALGLSILEVYDPNTLAKLVALADVDGLSLVPGVGRKTAQRLVIDLAEKLASPELSVSLLATERDTDARFEVREALVALGYGADEVRRVLEEISLDGPVEVILREALRLLAPRR